MTIQPKPQREETVSSSYLTETYRTVEEGRRVTARRLREAFAQEEACREAFAKDEARLAELHPAHQLPSPSREKTVTAERHLHDEPAFVTQGREMRRVAEEVMTAVEELHQGGTHHLHLHPKNVLLTKGDYAVRLTNPQGGYMGVFYLAEREPDGFTAPELSPEADLKRCDVYSVGKFIAWLYDMGTLPYRYRRAVHRACQTDPRKRPADIRALRRIIHQDTVKQHLFKGVLWMAAALLAGLLLLWATTTEGDEEIHFVEPTANYHYVYDSISGKEYYVNDSVMEAAHAARERENERMMEVYAQKVQEIFKREFREKAMPVLTDIYTKERLTGDAQTFSALNKKAMLQLQEVQAELAAQYELDGVTSAKAASEVIDELTREYVRQATAK